MRTILFACVSVLAALWLGISASDTFTTDQYKALPEAYMSDPRCRMSEFGIETCQQNLLRFVHQEGKEPLSDHELDLVFGCLRPDKSRNTVKQQTNLPGC